MHSRRNKVAVTRLVDFGAPPMAFVQGQRCHTPRILIGWSPLFVRRFTRHKLSSVVKKLSGIICILFHHILANTHPCLERLNACSLHESQSRFRERVLVHKYFTDRFWKSCIRQLREVKKKNCFTDTHTHLELFLHISRGPHFLSASNATDDLSFHKRSVLSVS